MNFKRYPNIYGEDKESTQKVQKVDEFIQKIKKAKIKVEEALKTTNKTMKQRTDKSREEAIKYKEGNLVWMDSSNISSNCPAKKLAFKKVRPFLMIKKIESSAYKLQIPKI